MFKSFFYSWGALMMKEFCHYNNHRVRKWENNKNLAYIHLRNKIKLQGKCLSWPLGWLGNFSIFLGNYLQSRKKTQNYQTNNYSITNTTVTLGCVPSPRNRFNIYSILNQLSPTVNKTKLSGINTTLNQQP